MNNYAKWVAKNPILTAVIALALLWAILNRDKIKNALSGDGGGDNSGGKSPSINVGGGGKGTTTFDAALNTPTLANIRAAIASGKVSGTKVLKKGVSGNEVKLLQAHLNLIGAADPLLEVDGAFGSATESALILAPQRYRQGAGTTLSLIAFEPA